MRSIALLLAAILFASCGDDGEGTIDTPEIVTATARFDVPAVGPIDWGDVPFPSDLYRDANGAVRIGALPVAQENALFAATRDLLQARDGFCATCNVYFPIDGEALDPASLPNGGEPSTGDSVVLVDVDPSSPERGRLFPLRVEWNELTRRLAVRPQRGIALHRKRRYAAALTANLRSADGFSVGASEEFRQVRGSGAAPAEVEKAREVFDSAFGELERIGLRRGRIVSLAAFTTEDVTADILSARAAVQAGAQPQVVIERWRRGTEIDELLGVPSVDRPGIDVPPAAGVAGSRSIAHGAIRDVITGYFLAPRILTGSGKDIGVALRNGQGEIDTAARQAVPFLLTLPIAPAAGPLPIVIEHHGFNSSRVTGFAVADTVARAGAATLSIDAHQHGERAPSARDDLHSLRGDVPGADGFAETSTADVSARVFGLIGTAPGLELFSGYSLGAFLQFGADVASTVRVVREHGLTDALNAAAPDRLSSFEFDVDRIGFIGNSLGAVVGASVLTAEPDLRFGVQNVPPGSIIETLTESPEFRPLVEAIFLPRLGVENTFDEVNRRLIFDPVIDLARWALEPVDPLALAPYLLRDPVRDGGAAEILFQVAGLDEVASALATQSMIDALGPARVTRYDPAAHGMLEVLDQSSKYEPPAAPPFRLREQELPIANPIVEEHEEIEDFLRENFGM